MGNETCGGLPGSLGHYATDSATLAEWGVDLVKAKACGIKDVRSCNSGKYYLTSVIHQYRHFTVHVFVWSAISCVLFSYFCVQT